MNTPNYRPRIADKLLERKLKSFGAVCVEGPMWCGKTTTALNKASSAFMIADSADNFANRKLTAIDINAPFANAAKPHLIDEWQEFPAIWDATRNHVDKSGEKGLYILTGSSSPVRDGIMHSGAGRIANFRMRPMSLWESGDSTGEVSLEAMCNGEAIGAVRNEPPSVAEIARLVLRGGWPGALDLDIDAALEIPAGYVDRLVNHTMPGFEEPRRNNKKFQLLLKSLARNESTAAGISALKHDISAKGDAQIEDKTLATYIDSLARLFVTEDIPPFAPAMRSSARIKKSVKRHFCDPSIAAALMNANEAKLLRDLNTLGFLFESLVIRDLLCYASAFGASVSHYQDYSGREADAIIEMPSGDWAAVEVKLGTNQEDAAAKSLLGIARKFAEGGAPGPKALIAIIGNAPVSYRRADGVYVAGATSLRP